MKNKFNLKDIIKKIKSNRAEETINKAILIIGGLVLVALLIAVLLTNGKNTINETGEMINSIFDTASGEAERRELANRCNSIDEQILNLQDEYNECMNHKYVNRSSGLGTGNGFIAVGCKVNGEDKEYKVLERNENIYFTENTNPVEIIIGKQISQLESQKSSMGCPL